ncbi:MAG: S16 family serine protease [Caldilineaceae bacterium]
MKELILAVIWISALIGANLAPSGLIYAAQESPYCQTEVAPLIYEDILGKPNGSVGRLLVTIEANPQDKLRLAFLESEVTAAGPLWRIAGWTAVMYSALLLAVDPDAYRITFDIEGSIDGPSAGALITSAVLACLLGDSIQPHITMTGTLHPDGTVGPVGGVYYKLQGAAEAGFKIVLIPKGQRMEQVDKLGERVDLIAHGRELGVTVREVSTIFEAYKALTLRDLPQPDADGSLADMSVPSLQPAPPINHQLLLLAKAATQLYRIQTAQADALTPAVRRQFAAELDAAETAFQVANQAVAAENGILAYDRSWRALYMLELVRRLARVEELKATGDIDELTGYLDELISDADYYYGRLLDNLNGRAPRRPLDVVTYAAVQQMSAPGTGLLLSFYSESTGNTGAETAQSAAEEFQDMLDVASWLAPAITRARFVSVAAHEILNAHMQPAASSADAAVYSAPALYAPAVLSAMDEIVANFAETNQEFLYYLVDDTDESVLADDVYQGLLSTTDGLYFLENEFLGLNTESARRGLNMRALVDSTMALTRYYMLEFDEGDPTQLTPAAEDQLDQMLLFGRQRALHALVLGQSSVANSTAVYHFALAESAPDAADLDSRLQRLGQYWEAALEAQLLSWISGAYDRAVANEVARTDRRADLWELGRIHPLWPNTQMTSLRAGAPNVSDEFTSGRGRQDLYDDEAGALFLQRNQLHVRINSPNQLVWYHTENSLTDFWTEVNVTHVDGDLTNGAGLIFGYEDDNNLYEFLIGVDGYYQLAQLADGEWTQIIEWTRSDAVQMGERTVNQLGLLVDGEGVTLMANGIVLAQLNNITIPPGELLLVTETFESDKAEFAFDNLNVWELPAEQPKPIPSPRQIGE